MHAKFKVGPLYDFVSLINSSSFVFFKVKLESLGDHYGFFCFSTTCCDGFTEFVRVSHNLKSKSHVKPDTTERIFYKFLDLVENGALVIGRLNLSISRLYDIVIKVVDPMAATL